MPPRTRIQRLKPISEYQTDHTSICRSTTLSSAPPVSLCPGQPQSSRRTTARLQARQPALHTAPRWRLSSPLQLPRLRKSSATHPVRWRLPCESTSYMDNVAVSRAACLTIVRRQPWCARCTRVYPRKDHTPERGICAGSWVRRR